MSRDRHDPTDPFHASAYCGPCRTERAAGLTAYSSWRDTAPDHVFTDGTPTPDHGAEPRAVVRRVKAGVWGGRLHYADTWVWWVHEDGPTYRGGRQLDFGYAPTWAAALAQAEAAVLVARVGIAGLVAA